MTETSIILALQPKLVARDVKKARSQAGETMTDLERIAAAPDWPGYFGDPALASASLGRRNYDEWVRRSEEFVKRILAGENYRTSPRLADLGADDPADAAADAVNRGLEAQHEVWLRNRSKEPRQLK